MTNEEHSTSNKASGMNHATPNEGRSPSNEVSDMKGKTETKNEIIFSKPGYYSVFNCPKKIIVKNDGVTLNAINCRQITMPRGTLLADHCKYIDLYMEAVGAYLKTCPKVVSSGAILTAMECRITLRLDAIVQRAFHSEIRANDNACVLFATTYCIEAFDKSYLRHAGDDCKVVLHDYATSQYCNNVTAAGDHHGQIISGFTRAEQDMTVFKQLRDNRLAELTVPKGADIYIGNKQYRTNKVRVNRIYDADGTGYDEGYSLYDETFLYITHAEMQVPMSMDNVDYASGIHFYLTEKEALEYDN
ncbi:MAG: DUF5758 domain-containing protein [Zoogloeaceae bacterium]|jgi:hypothetical protein|nr:DUF5758 domain-containing protein [Zoogloeaceae bacterium]